MSNIESVVAVVVDKTQATFYKQNGDTIIVKQGDYRLKRLIEEVLKFCPKGEIAELDFSAKSSETAHLENLDTYQEKSGGIVKFFRITRNKLASIFKEAIPQTAEDVPEQVMGMTPKPAAEPEAKDIAAQVAEVMAHAKPLSEGVDNSLLADDAPEKEAQTIVAVVNGKAVIPDVHKLDAQFEHSNKLGNSPEGMKNFLARLATVANKRQHSAEDLMKFMQRGDLPIADDGCIVIYKVLRKRANSRSGVSFDYVDCHSGNVLQKVGARVFMRESLVDHDRRNECSNGLHVARRQYVGKFSGDVLTICKVRPEDVIAVPEYDANKMRVSAYDILGEFSAADYALISADKPIGSYEGKMMLANVLAGHHVIISVTVEIGSGQGGDLTITSMKDLPADDQLVMPVAVDKAAAGEDETVIPADLEIQPSLVGEKDQKEAAPLDVNALAQDVADVKAIGQTKAQKAKELYECFKNSKGQEKKDWAKELALFKKTSKKGWTVLGLTDNIGEQVLKAAE